MAHGREVLWPICCFPLCVSLAHPCLPLLCRASPIASKQCDNCDNCALLIICLADPTAFGSLLSQTTPPSAWLGDAAITTDRHIPIRPACAATLLTAHPVGPSSANRRSVHDSLISPVDCHRLDRLTRRPFSHFLAIPHSRPPKHTHPSAATSCDNQWICYGCAAVVALDTGQPRGTVTAIKPEGRAKRDKEGQ